MKKKLILLSIIPILLLMIFLFRGNKEEYYQNIADIVVGFYRNDEFNEKDIKAKDLPSVKDFLSKLTHKGEIISLDEYIIKEDDYYTDLYNTQGVYKKDDKCYIEYKYLKFEEQKDEEIVIEPYKQVICDNYFTILYESDFYPSYDVTKANPKYNYVFQKSEKSMSGYTYTYYSTYDNSPLTVILIINNKVIQKIEVKF